MTQAFNLSQLANNLNTSGQLDATDGLTGLVPLANGGTGASNTVNTVVAGSGISVSTSGTQVTVSSSGGAGTVTSVATGNGLSGGTITTSGTLIIACPTHNTVGSYAFIMTQGGNTVATFGSNYSAGTNQGQFTAGAIRVNQDNNSFDWSWSNSLSGTWKWLGASVSQSSQYYFGIACRVA